MTRVALECITMVGSDYALFQRDGTTTFPHGELQKGEDPAAGAKRIIKEWTKTDDPKLEVVDFIAADDTLTIVFRGILTSEPAGVASKHNRMDLPKTVGALEGAWVNEALKTGLAYKLTRR